MRTKELIVEEEFEYCGFKCMVMLIKLPKEEVKFLNEFNKKQNKPLIQVSWRCGYVGIDKTHPYFNISREKVERDINIHGGITYCKLGYGEFFEKKLRWFGFDCNHLLDNLKHCNFKYVKNQVKSLARQLKKDNIILRELEK